MSDNGIKLLGDDGKPINALVVDGIAYGADEFPPRLAEALRTLQEILGEHVANGNAERSLSAARARRDAARGAATKANSDPATIAAAIAQARTPGFRRGVIAALHHENIDGMRSFAEADGYLYYQVFPPDFKGGALKRLDQALEIVEYIVRLYDTNLETNTDMLILGDLLQ